MSPATVAQFVDIDAELIAILEAADRGELTIEYGTWVDGVWAARGATGVWERVYAGNVMFVLGNGWKVIVFNDCDEWDYIEDMLAPDGTSQEIWEHPVTGPSNVRRIVADWAPRDIKKWAPDAGCDTKYEREFWEQTYRTESP